MKKGITTLFLGLAVALGAQAQEYNLFYDVDEDGWLWFDSQEKIDKYVGTCDEENYCVNPNGKPIQLIYADYQPDYPSATADPTFVGAGAEGELGAEGARTGALIIPGASSFAGTNGGGFVVLMPSCASYDICMSCEEQARAHLALETSGGDSLEAHPSAGDELFLEACTAADRVGVTREHAADVR